MFGYRVLGFGVNDPIDVVGGDVGLTADTMQGVFGEYKATLNTSVTSTQNNVQAVFGEFKYIIDNSNVST